MQGLSWPQTAVVEPGKLLRHYADSRFKLFAWQACDWIDVGPVDAMRVLAGLAQWVDTHYVFSVAQFVEHAYLVDRGVAYQPLQLYINIRRAKGKDVG
jgi:hypothetical protein